MTTLLLRLAGPMQAWGAPKRFARRDTRTEPTKSGVVGLLAAAQGRRRTDPIEDLAALRFGVRVDQPGVLLRDFQTARTLDGKESMPLSYRYYLSDAVFVAGVEGDSALVRGLVEAVRAPAFPLYLGRRSCPPSQPLVAAVSEDSLLPALRAAPWEAAPWHRRRAAQEVRLDLVVDRGPEHEETEIEVVRDVPESFDPQRRRYGSRDVVREEPVVVENELGRAGVDFLGLYGSV